MSAAVVRNVSFDLKSGQGTVLVGGSGSGKTTLASALMGTLKPMQGHVLLMGEDISATRGARLRETRRAMQMVYQDPYDALDPRLTVEDAVAEPLLIHFGRRDRDGYQARVCEALERVELQPRQVLRKYPHELSGGQRQRVAIAAALVLDPAVLIADEPVSMLDVSHRGAILRLLRDECERGMTLLMITHDLSTAALFADRALVMFEGRIVEDGSAHDVLTQPRDPYTRRLVAAIPRLDPRLRGLISHDGESPSISPTLV